MENEKAERLWKKYAHVYCTEAEEVSMDKLGFTQAITDLLQQKPIDKWYCSHCNKIIQPEEVTFEETHDIRYGGCGEKVSGKSSKLNWEQLEKEFELKVATIQRFFKNDKKYVNGEISEEVYNNSFENAEKITNGLLEWFKLKLKGE